MAASQTVGIEVRELTTIDEFGEAVALQKEIWGFADIELLPRRLFVVAHKIGGQTLGAFDQGRMVAFLIAIPGLKQGSKIYLHSHMTGALPAYRDKGLGRLLKLKQREDALSRDIDLVEWTFDPLELRNAYFNIEKLGAVVRRYVLNQYGTTSSHLHGGLPTDRCIAEWWIREPRVQDIIDRKPIDRSNVTERIAVPADIAEIRVNEPKKAKFIQESLSRQFLEHFRNGLAVIGFEKSPEAGTYLLGPWE